MTQQVKLLLRWLALHKYAVVRISTGLFLAYFFIFYFYSFEHFYLFRANNSPGIINQLQEIFGPENFVLLLKSGLIFFTAASLSFAFGTLARISALAVWFGYTFFYNFYLCINQPHISYLLYILITYVFISNESFFSNDRKKKFARRGFLWILTSVYMIQMSISGFSKLLSPEWRSGHALGLMSQIRDPEPGIYLLGFLPDLVLRNATWFVLILECATFLYLFIPKLRLPIWLAHVVLYFGIALLVPHATHVAFVMLIFNVLILDPKILRKNI